MTQKKIQPSTMKKVIIISTSSEADCLTKFNKEMVYMLC